MREIGDQLRETRMRNRIDITEVEAATKIRAKYLRALENEEWELLPGPTFVTTFLRTYADYLRIDSRTLVAEYRARFERPSGPEITSFGTNLGSRRSRPRRSVAAPWMALVAVGLVLVAALYLLGRWGDDPGDEEVADRTPVPAATGTGGGDRGSGDESGSATGRKHVRLQIQPTGDVSVCLVNAGGERLIRNETLAAGQDTRTFRGRRFRVSFGTGAAVMRVDGKRYAVSRDAPVGYEVRAGKRPRALSEARRPTCG
jgi:hypothetical protein